MNLKRMTEEALVRKREQHARMANLALCDNDPKDAERHLRLERLYAQELQRRKEQL